MAERSEAKKRETKLRVKNKNLYFFDAKLRFALICFATLSHFLPNLCEQLNGHFTRKG